MSITYSTDATFKTDIAEGIVLVDFYADWCGPCKMIAPALEALAPEIADYAKIVKVDTDKCQATAREYGVMSIPTLILFKNGEKVNQSVGFQPKEALKALVDSAK